VGRPSTAAAITSRSRSLARARGRSGGDVDLGAARSRRPGRCARR
jgi:hypothetical protein